MFTTTSSSLEKTSERKKIAKIIKTEKKQVVCVVETKKNYPKKLVNSKQRMIPFLCWYMEIEKDRIRKNSVKKIP